METELKLSGTCKWAKVYESNKALQYEETDKYEFTIDLYPDEESLRMLEEWKASATKNRNKIYEQDKEGEGPYIRLRRPEYAKFTDEEGNPVYFGPPGVFDADEQLTEALIGNGSSVTCKVKAYSNARSSGLRLMQVRVDKLVEYQAEDELNVKDVPF